MGALPANRKKSKDGEVLGALEDFIKELLVSALTSLLTSSMDFLEMSFAEDGGLKLLGQSPTEALPEGIYEAVLSIANASIVPVGYTILAFVLCIDFITMCVSGNNFQGFDTSIFFKFALKGWAGIYLMGKAGTIAQAFFELGAEMTTKAQTALGDAAKFKLEGTVDFSQVLTEKLLENDVGMLMGLVLLALLLYIVVIAIYVVTFVVLLGRVLEMAIYSSFAAIPMATIMNRGINGVGANYLKNVGALAFQSILIMVVLGIFTGLMTSVLKTAITNVEELNSMLLQSIAYGIVLCFTMLKTGQISKSIFQAS